MNLMMSNTPPIRSRCSKSLRERRRDEEDNRGSTSRPPAPPVSFSPHPRNAQKTRTARCIGVRRRAPRRRGRRRGVRGRLGCPDTSSAARRASKRDDSPRHRHNPGPQFTLCTSESTASPTGPTKAGLKRPGDAPGTRRTRPAASPAPLARSPAAPPLQHPASRSVPRLAGPPDSRVPPWRVARCELRRLPDTSALRAASRRNAAGHFRAPVSPPWSVRAPARSLGPAPHA